MTDARGPALEVEGLTKRFEPRPGEGRGRGPVTALEDVSFRVAPGRTLGVIGHNGSGKTTLLRLLAGALMPSAGSVRVHGDALAMIEPGGGFDEALTGRENVILYGTFLGLARREVVDRIPEVASFAGIGDAIDRPFGSYSTGMRLRLFFATALLGDPDVLLIDEVIAVGDEEFQHKSFGRIWELKQRGKTIVLVSHSMETIRGFCDEALCLDGGRVLAQGSCDEVVARYLERAWDRERDDLREVTRRGRGALEELDRRVADLDRAVAERRWVPRRLRAREAERERRMLDEELRSTREDLDERFRRMLAYLDARMTLGREAQLREALPAEDLDFFDDALDEATRFYAGVGRGEDALTRWKELAYSEIERAAAASDGDAERRGRRMLLRALGREVEMRAPGPARERAQLERLGALSGLQRAGLGGSEVIERMIDLVAETVLDEALDPRPSESFRRAALDQLEGVVHDLFRDERAGDDADRRATFERWMARLGEAPEGSFRRVGPLWMVDRVREQVARAALAAEGEDGAARQLLAELEERVVGRGQAGGGSGPMRILAVRFLDAHGQPLERALSGATLTIEIHFEAVEPVEDPMLGIGIHEPGGVVLAAPNTSASGAAVGRVEGAGRARLVIESLPLTPGVYPVSVSAMDRTGSTLFDYHDRSHLLRVDDPQSAEVLGRIRLAARWEVEV